MATEEAKTVEIKVSDINQKWIGVKGLKEILGTDKLPLSRVFNEDGEETEFLKYWDNDNRVLLILGNNTLDTLKQGNEVMLRAESRTAEQGEYIHIMAVSPKIEVIL